MEVSIRQMLTESSGRTLLAIGFMKAIFFSRKGG